MGVNDDAVCLKQRGASESIAGKPRSYRPHSSPVAAAEGCDRDRRARKA
ncbi:hypothetical protein C4K05_2585 [Pseudomonas chlororaphis subsp. aureofaciens]|uniref:Uncharacterized protein n=1 Tax=Pseudomonas chlororaphis subsp. aureofaciens TaxID=587851 RepID=A0AAD1E607_9PSED|nr:hypothetical protein C4K10_2529 [Pseudomonas chlororaphis subsp. aureofaciens]AZE22976.1 hypothetical protein C4K08_2549 [Pseudomonas chlororaphis subsp. aureofaciens]AZE29271.1 hypothetical protein C4K07_2486 [Pseudomonas chlororaphis subsp. aureofaciens]AZE35571.1 hypothetical protein C4K06_2538 [Pseudomonas chlororaphis subsp. aureofaciens]AZE41925.1 hypothetical protein C4K05_2585 [Pseudomonas chlororaphis subsp. aureofaciens]